jgi:hypothetical protein
MPLKNEKRRLFAGDWTNEILSQASEKDEEFLSVWPKELHEPLVKLGKRTV